MQEVLETIKKYEEEEDEEWYYYHYKYRSSWAEVKLVLLFVCDKSTYTFESISAVKDVLCKISFVQVPVT